MSTAPSPTITSPTQTSPVVINKSLICQDSTVSNGVQIAIGTVLHPRSSIIISEGAGPIIIGENNIIEELVQIVNKSPEPMIIGSNNLFEVGSYIECKSIGNGNVFEPKCKILKNTIIKDQCSIGAGCIVSEDKICENNTIIAQTQNSQIQTTSTLPYDHHSSIHMTHLELLHKSIPLFHTIKKTPILEK
ncbi:dynactin subunit p27 [Dictyostelium discoideum AX4]|uniref:Dynactin subunit 6 n=1 Tax=Dictyostelium discoideum TaxID=44689 RepID=DCTN6_DICDI|nr:dynactin subunit p27 [Dictyostelium discoideum AX4]Q54FM4.1 RecName: Full=Dynactin subunit 6 [Dictyostelium discoideum]EAL62063.1 dynactin subunit p27 [Dictyostelium discoideum AX4]|eukprot:XP_635567.1 dynactin subunit p27 [Dictyostelium discoideum AX4]